MDKDNLINFDEENIPIPNTPKPIFSPNSTVLIPQRLSVDLTNPIEKLDYFVQYADPFDCLDFADIKQKDGSVQDLHLQDGSVFSFDCFSCVDSSIDSSRVATGSSQNSSLTSQKTVVSRSQSDSSTISSKSEKFNAMVNRSVDNVPSKHQQLLKLSFYNSPNSPMNNTSFNNTSLADSISLEARKIAKRFAECGDMSFEDLNNVSQNLVDSTENISQNLSVDAELQEMKISVDKLSHTVTTPTPDKIAMFQEQLNRIKKEVVEVDFEEIPEVEVKDEKKSPKPAVHSGAGDKQSELDLILNKLKSVYTDGNKDEAKKQLNRLNELLGNHQEPKNTLHVQPIVRQDTFEIEEKTGKRKYSEKSDKDDVMEQLTKILGGHSLDVHSMGLNDSTKIVVVVPTNASTPVKGLHRRLSFSQAQKPQTASKKHETPMKHTMSRLSSFTTPRPGKSGGHPYDQKLGVQSRAGCVRKSLMTSMEKSPQVQKASAPTRNLVRRSVSLKSSVPSVQVTKSSPTKTAKPLTNATPARRLSHALPSRPSTTSKVRPATVDQKKQPISSQFKAPAAVRKGLDKSNLV